MLTSFSYASVSLVALMLVAGCGGSTSSGPPDDGTPATSGTSTAAPATPVTKTPSTPTTPTTPTTTPPTAPTTPPVTPPPGACNTIMNDATTIGAEMVPTDAPPSVGGTIADGTYHLTNISVFTRAGGGSGSLPLSIQETIHIQGTNVEVIGNANGTLERVSETFVTNGDAVTFTQTCPSPGKPASIAHYSISGTTLTMFMVNDAGQTVSYAYTP